MLGLTPWGRPIGFIEVSSGIILLLEPMDLVCKQTNEKQTKEVCLCLNINKDDLNMYKENWICT